MLVRSVLAGLDRRVRPLARPLGVRLLTVTAVALLACGDAASSERKTASPETSPPAANPAPSRRASAPTTPANLPTGLLVALSVFESGADGKPVPKSELLLLRRRDDRWQVDSHTDPDSNVFHKAMVYTPPGEPPGILTLGGSAAAVKLWRAGAEGLEAETLWQADFGGKFSRMRDAEVGPVYGDGKPTIAVATHDQGVVALLQPEGGRYAVKEIDRKPGKFVHEIEIGDLDGDGALEVYATPSDPNKLDGSVQHGSVVRYVPSRGEGPVEVADLGDRHAKEILVEDVDGDGIDELYVSIEAAEGGALAIKRWDATTPASQGTVVASLNDPMCRFLTAGDLDGDGVKELVAAAKDTGLWLLRPGKDVRAPWSIEHIDADSRGFEHAALLTDLDGDGRDELYVASDKDRELRRYVDVDGGFAREVLHRHSGGLPLLTWNLMPFPADLVP